MVSRSQKALIGLSTIAIVGMLAGWREFSKAFDKLIGEHK